MEIDQVDLKILEILTQNADTPYTEVAKRLQVSDGTIHVRMRRMKEMGIIKGAQLVIDYSKLGWDIDAFLGIYLDRSSLYDEVVTELKKIPEVVEMHYTTGAYSIFVRIICQDTKHLKSVLHDKIQKVNGIQRTETFITLDKSLVRSIQFEAIQQGQ